MRSRAQHSKAPNSCFHNRLFLPLLLTCETILLVSNSFFIVDELSSFQLIRFSMVFWMCTCRTYIFFPLFALSLSKLLYRVSISKWTPNILWLISGLIWTISRCREIGIWVSTIDFWIACTLLRETSSRFLTQLWLTVLASLRTVSHRGRQCCTTRKKVI